MIAVVIVTFSAAAEMLEACIASVRTAGDAGQIIVVDNGGNAVVPEGVEVVLPGHNLGFGGGANAGFRRAGQLGATAVALLNDDIEVESGWLGPFRDALDADPAVGAVQPKLLLAGSQPALVNSVGVTIDRYGAGSDIGHGRVDGPEFDSDRVIELFTGGAVLFRGEFLEATGGFDETFFLYYEDIDLARRGAALGWTYRCVPSSRVWHRGSASTAKLGAVARYWQERNRLRTVIRFGDRDQLRRAAWLSIRRLRWPPRAAHAKALAAAVLSAPATVRARRRAAHR